MDSILDIKNFPLLESTITDANVFKRIRLLCIFGCNAAEVIFGTNDDKIYCFGRNRFGGLGLGVEEENIVSPRLNPFLSDRQVVNILCGFEHWIALTRSGRCYAWGHNQFGQLGVGEGVSDTTTPVFIAELTNSKVVDMCCGAQHSLARTSDGRVYGWGDNTYGQIGDNSTQCRWTPRIIYFDEEVVSISCGRSHSMALTITGKVYVWGLNSYGQLGSPTLNKRYICSRPQPIVDFETISFSKGICGPNFSLLLSADGYVYAFGDNACGQVGNGSTESQLTPFRVSDHIKFKDIVAHKENDISVAVTTDDKFYVWGLAKNRRFLAPKEVTDSAEKSVFDIYAIYAKKNVTQRTIVINNEIKSWERCYRADIDFDDFTEVEMNDKLQDLAIDSYVDDMDSDCNNTNDWQIKKSKAKKPKIRRTTLDKVMDIKMCLKNPKIIEDSMIRSIRLVRVFGLYGSKVIFATIDDKVYAFGHNRDLSLGLGISEEHILKPELIRELCGQHLVDIATGYEHCIAMTATGQCFGWGQNSFGQLGIGTINPSNRPKPIKELNDTKVVQISCGSYHSLALTSDGELFAWGHNTFAQLGDRTYNSRETPTQVMIPETIGYVTCGLNHSVALTPKGRVYVWGGNENGQLGRPPELDVRQSREKPMSNRPHVIKQLESAVIVKAVCGSNHSLFLSNNGSVYACGDNACGQVGNGTTVDQFLPMKLNKEFKIRDIISQYDNDMSIAVTEDDKCFVWGFVQKKNILMPTEISNPSGKSLFDIYAKLAKNKVTFKTVVVEEDFLKYVMPLKTNKNKEAVKEFHPTLRTDPSKSYSQITASNDRHSSVGSEQNGSELYNDSKIRSIWDLNEESVTVHGSDEDLHIVSNLEDAMEEGGDVTVVPNNFKNTTKEEDMNIVTNLETNDGNEKVFNKCQNFIINVDSVSEEPKQLNCSPKSPENLSFVAEDKDLTTCGQTFLSRLRQNYNNGNTSDLRIRSGDNVIHCHKTIISIRNDMFWRICAKELNENNEIIVNPESYQPFEAFVQYLYAIEPKVEPLFAGELLSMARIFGESELQALCAQVIKKAEISINLTNVCPIYERALKEGLPDLEQKCIQFAASNWKAVLKSDAFEAMSDPLSKRLVISVLNN